MGDTVLTHEIPLTVKGRPKHSQDELVCRIVEEFSCYPGVGETVKALLASLFEMFTTRLQKAHTSSNNQVQLGLDEFLTYILDKKSLKKKNSVLIEAILNKIVELGYLRKEFNNEVFFMGPEFNVFQIGVKNFMEES